MEIETFHGDGLVNLGWKIGTFYPFFYYDPITYNFTTKQSYLHH